jgi:citrate/tricarballylate utilization protein
MHATDAQTEAARLFVVCNSCRYCEGLCAVFPSMELRASFTAADADYLANLCHGCGACYYDCQFAPPHEFAVNVPAVLAQVRNESYKHYAWPPGAGALFERNGLAIALAAALGVAGFVLGFVAVHSPGDLFAVHSGPGAFYRLMPHNAMAALFGAAFLFAVFAIALGARRFARATAATLQVPGDTPGFWAATRDALQLRYLDGGGVGCMNADERPTDRRRLWHHLTFYGFMLCVASTSVATLYHYAFGRIAPYPWWDLPVLLGMAGGLGLLAGPLGLLHANRTRDPALRDNAAQGGETAFLAMLFLTSVTGLLLLALRDTPAMGVLLAVHLGVVFAFFVTMPYGKFVHGIYRFAALVRHARERRLIAAGG